jgi:hypothetical protein
MGFDGMAAFTAANFIVILLTITPAAPGALPVRSKTAPSLRYLQVEIAKLLA